MPILRISEVEHADVVTRLRAGGCVFAEAETRRLLRWAPDAATLEAWVARRVRGEPLELIVGFARFGEIDVAVHCGVFVPRRRSLLLVRESARSLPSDGRYLDLCTGTGAIAAAVRALRPDARILVSDLDRRAADCARQNLPGCWVGTGDLFEPVPDQVRGRLDVITVSAPYVPAGEMARLPREARDYEPPHALCGGADGLDVYRRVLSEAPSWLSGSGIALFEIGEPQGEPLVRLCRDAGLGCEIVRGAEGGYAVRAHG